MALNVKIGNQDSESYLNPHDSDLNQDITQ